jgi:hypothetical protein
MQTSCIPRNNTVIISTPHVWAMEYRGNRIVHVDKTSHSCRVDHCGFVATTTRTRLTQFFREKDIRNASVYIKKGEMFLRLNGADVKMNPAASFTLATAEIETLFGKV